jgi:hypothetical protein
MRGKHSFLVYGFCTARESNTQNMRIGLYSGGFSFVCLHHWRICRRFWRLRTFIHSVVPLSAHTFCSVLFCRVSVERMNTLSILCEHVKIWRFEL